jgi:hypothetical protein
VPVESDSQGSDIQWDQDWLIGNWPAVIDALSYARQMPIAGVLGPAGVLRFASGVLDLEYSADYEGLRRRGVSIIDDVNAAMTSLANTDIRCNLLAADGADTQGPIARAFGGLSTAETAEIAEDPSVKTLIDSFDGSLLDVRRDPGAGLIPTDPIESEDQ